MFNVVDPVGFTTFDGKENRDDGAKLPVFTKWKDLETLIVEPLTSGKLSVMKRGTLSIPDKRNIFSTLKPLTFGDTLIGKLKQSESKSDSSTNLTIKSVVESTIETLRHLFFERGGGTFVNIQSGRLKLFVTFRNPELDTDVSDSATDRTDRTDASNRRDEGDRWRPMLMTLLLELCRTRCLPTVSFFVSHDPMFARDSKVLTHVAQGTRSVPVCSLYSSSKWNDLLVPFTYHHANSQTSVDDKSKVVAWKDKQPKCFFRGTSSTSQGKRLFDMINTPGPDGEDWSTLIDVEFTPDDPQQSAKESKLQQSDYKYILCGGVPPPYPPATSSATSSISSGSASVAGAPKVGGATPVGDAIPVAAYRYQECCNAMTELVYNLKKHNNYHAVADLYCQRNGREWSLFYDDEVEASASLAEKKKLESKPYFSTAVPPKSQVASNEPKLSKTQKKNAKKRLKKSNQKVVTLPTVASSSSTT